MGKNIAAFLIAVVLLCIPLSACGATDAAADKIQNVTVNGGAAIVTLYSADNANVVLASFTSDGRMSACQGVAVDGSAEMKTVSLELSEQSLSARFIKAFLLDDDFTPLCQPFHFDLSGQDALPLPSQLAEIPESYYSKAERQGTLQNLYYDTWESFSYDAKTRPLQKHAVVYLPYGYDETKRYNYYMHGGGGTEERPLGTVNAPRRFKNVIDHAIEDGKALPAIIVCPTYNNTNENGLDSNSFSFAMRLPTIITNP